MNIEDIQQLYVVGGISDRIVEHLSNKLACSLPYGLEYADVDDPDYIVVTHKGKDYWVEVQVEVWPYDE